MVPQLIMKPTSLFKNSGNSWTTCRKHDPPVTRLWGETPRTTTDYWRCTVATMFCRIPRPEFSSSNETYIATYTYMKIYRIIVCMYIYIYRCCINWINVTIQILFLEILFFVWIFVCHVETPGSMFSKKQTPKPAWYQPPTRSVVDLTNPKLFKPIGSIAIWDWSDWKKI